VAKLKPVFAVVVIIAKEVKMGKVEKKDSRPDFFAQGGSTSMFGKGTAHDSLSGQSGKESNGGGGKKFAEGGSGHMFGKGHAGKKIPGQSGKESQEG
jgi:hypothetical protein